MRNASPTYRSNTEYYNLTKVKSRYSNTSISRPIIWLTLSQSFYFFAYALLIIASGFSHITACRVEQSLLLKLLPIVGIVSCVFSFRFIMVRILDVPLQVKTSADTYSKTIAATCISPYPNSWFMGILEQIVPLFLPLLFFICWGIILVNTYCV